MEVVEAKPKRNERSPMPPRSWWLPATSQASLLSMTIGLESEHTVVGMEHRVF